MTGTEARYSVNFCLHSIRHRIPWVTPRSSRGYVMGFAPFGCCAVQVIHNWQYACFSRHEGVITFQTE